MGDPEAGPRSSVKENGQGERDKVMKGRMGRDQETKKDVEDDVRCSPATSNKEGKAVFVFVCLYLVSARKGPPDGHAVSPDNAAGTEDRRGARIAAGKFWWLSKSDLVKLEATE